VSYPNTIDSPGGTAAQGTSLLTSPDHGLDHRIIGSAIVNLETKVGVNSGSPTVNLLLFGVGAGSSTWGSQGTALTFTNSTFNSGTIGTPAITGGTANSQTVGTPAITGGTYNSGVFGTPTVTGGMSLSANGSITQTSTADHITLTPGASKLVRFAATRQDITTNTYQNQTVMQHGWFFITGDGSGVNSGTITFPQAFSGTPVVLVTGLGGKSGSDPTTIADMTTTGTSYDAYVPQINTIGTASFKYTIDLVNGASFTSTLRRGFAWVAYGTA